MNSLSKNLLLRVYFFGGLILFVGLSILLSILNGAPQGYLVASKWVFSGVIVSIIPIILSTAGMLGFTRKMHADNSTNKYLSIFINGIALSLLSLALVSIFIVGRSRYAEKGLDV